MIESVIKKIDKITDIWAGFLKGQVFYIPTLGPIYTSGNSIEKFLRDVLSNSQSDNFLPYDKNKRWHKEKKEKVLLLAIVINSRGLYIPVKSSLKNNVLKVFHYSTNALDKSVIKKAEKVAMNLKDGEKIESCFLYCFEKPETKERLSCHNIYLKKITKKEYLTKFPEEICYYHDLANGVKQSFARLGQEPELEGFGFLWKEFIAKSKSLSPIICALKGEKIIGAIGPLTISKDFWNTLWLLPPYFGVRKEERRNGYGEKLWKAAMNFAYRRGAKYTLVQNIANSPAACFYEKQGLVKKGEVYSIPLTV